MKSHLDHAIAKVRSQMEGQPSASEIERVKSIEHKQRDTQGISDEDKTFMQGMIGKPPAYFQMLIEEGKAR